jgi:hypothetical protein
MAAGAFRGGRRWRLFISNILYRSVLLGRSASMLPFGPTRVAAGLRDFLPLCSLRHLLVGLEERKRRNVDIA